MTGAPRRVAAGRVVVVLEDGDTVNPPLSSPVVPDTVLTAAARRGAEPVRVTTRPEAADHALVRAVRVVCGGLAALGGALADADRRDRYALAGPADGGVA